MANVLYKNNSVIITQIDSYNALKQASKPLINSVVLEGNRTSGELNMYTKDEVNQLIALSRQVYLSASIPANPQRNTMYYVGTSTPYDIYLYDNNLDRISLGTTNFDFSAYQEKVDNNLTTTSKNIVGAINELKSEVDLKQNKIDDTLITTNKNIVSAINELKSDVDLKQNQTDNTLQTTSKEIVGAINELESRNNITYILDKTGTVTWGTNSYTMKWVISKTKQGSKYIYDCYGYTGSQNVSGTLSTSNWGNEFKLFPVLTIVPPNELSTYSNIFTNDISSDGSQYLALKAMDFKIYPLRKDTNTPSKIAVTCRGILVSDTEIM